MDSQKGNDQNQKISNLIVIEEDTDENAIDCVTLGS